MTTAAGGPPVLYSFRRCPYAMRARLALAASGTACRLREVVLRDKPPALLAASPKGTVPVLVLADGTVLEQSLDIMRWALARHDPFGWLPGDAAARTAADTLVAACDGPFKHHLDRYKYPERYPGEEALVHRAAAAGRVAALEARLAGGPGLLGRWGLADAATLPFVRQFAAVDPAWFAAQPWPAVRAWLDAFLASPLFAQVMVRHAAWQDGLPDVAFP